LHNSAVSYDRGTGIFGQEKPRITYGLYSGGTPLAQKREPIDKLKYPTQGGSTKRENNRVRRLRT
jgi:hypothetical protein